ncbi:hypothetical protein [Kangiella sp. TOML190]|uniref:hypothetical protein n=1 Tax=Kangiella sp. TOML190 TaxID=2931351 RepID=UPI00204251D4|nr:hypothetical protein [Kangiella sp. TOML190]
MLLIALEEKNSNFVGTVLHKATNKREKQSSKSAEKAIATCFTRIDDFLFNRRYIILYFENGVLTKLIVNGLYEFTLNNVTVEEIESMLDEVKLDVLSVHAFKESKTKCYSYDLGRQDLTRLYELFIKSESMVIDSSD